MYETAMVGSDHDIAWPMPTLVEVEPGKFRVFKKTVTPARSSLPMPYIISDEMPPTEQVDGVHYTSKRAFRAVGRALGLTEVGDQKFPPKKRASEHRSNKQKRRATLERAIAQYRSGRRARREA
jgi:hypothetical protein